MIEHLDDTVKLDPGLSRLDVHNVLVSGVNLAWKMHGNNATMSTCANFVAFTIQENERLRADNIRHLAMLREIAEYCSGDGQPLGAIERLAAIRNTAHRAVQTHEQSSPTRCEHGLQRNLCGKCSVGLEIK